MLDVLCPNRIQRTLRLLRACNTTAESCGFISPVSVRHSPLYPIWTLGPPQGLFRPLRAAAFRCATPTEPGPDTQRLSPGWRVRQQAPSCAVRPGTFRAAGCGLLRAGAFDDVRDRNPVPRRVRCPRPEGNVPGRAGCPRWRPGAGPRCVQAQARDVSSSGLRAPWFRLGRAARPGQLAHAGSPRRAVGPAPGRCSPHAWPQHRRRPPVVRRSARSTAPAP